MDKLLNERQLADRLGISTRTLQQWRVYGKGPPFHKVGRAVRYTLNDIEYFLECQQRHSTADRPQEPSAAL